MIKDWNAFFDFAPMELSVAVKPGCPLADLTTFRIGGPAGCVVTVDSIPAIAAVVARVRQENLPCLLLGGGSNLLISDQGFEGVAILNRINTCEQQHNCLTVSSGCSLYAVVQSLVADGWAGLEELAGIPGSVGGAVVGNAGAFGRNIGELVRRVVVLDRRGNTQQLGADQLDFGYRNSRFKTSGEVVLSVELELVKSDAGKLRQRVAGILAHRQERHPPWGTACAGSFFQNLPAPVPGQRRVAAGLLLDQSGARGLSRGDAAVFEKHANIIINRGHASSDDVWQLAAQLRQMAFDHAGVCLEPEVRMVGLPDLPQPVPA